MSQESTWRKEKWAKDAPVPVMDEALDNIQTDDKRPPTLAEGVKESQYVMEQGSFIIKDLTGDWPVYPGHPLVVATAIMKVFPDFDAADAPTGHGWCAALGDDRIPGAGDHVGAAVRVLKIGTMGGSVEEMIAYANDYWTRGQAGGHVSNVPAGVVQAAAVRPHFEAAATAWFAAGLA